MQVQEPVSGQTVLPNDNGDIIIASKIIYSSRELYGQKIIKLSPTIKIHKPVEQTKPKTTKKVRHLI